MLNLFRSPKNSEVVDVQQPKPTLDASLLQQLQHKLNIDEKELFIQSFSTYLNVDKEKDYIVDLDSIWSWLGYTRKVKAKDLLEKHFTKDVDYQVLLSRSGKQRGGHNKKQYVMNVKTFKKLCLKADTKKADQIHDYYVKMEEILFEYTQEQLKFQTEKLKQKEQELLAYKQKTYEEIQKTGHIKFKVLVIITTITNAESFSES